MLGRRIVYCVALIVSLIAFIAANNREALIIFVTLVAGSVFSFLMLALGKNTTVKMKLSPHPNGGFDQGADLQIQIFGKKMLPLETIKMTISYENLLYGTVERKTFFLRPGSDDTMEYNWEWEEFDCGSYTLRTEKVVIYDIFGIWSLNVTPPNKFQMISYPYVPNIEVMKSDAAKSNDEGEKFDLHVSGNDVTEVHDLRNYNEGDSLGSIHWKLSGKLDKLVVREFSKPTNDRTALVCQGGFPGFEEHHRVVNGVIGLTAAISQGLVRAGIVHHISVVQQERILSRPVYDSKEPLEIISDILHLSLSKYKSILAVAKTNPLTERVILITGRLDEELMEALSERTNLTVILVSEGSKEYVDERVHFKILALPLENLDKKIHQLEL